GEQVAKVRGGTKLAAPSRQEIVQQHTVGGTGRGLEISDEGRLRFASGEFRRGGTVGIRGRSGPGRDAGVGGKPFANLLAALVVCSAGKPATAFASESQRIGDCLRPVAPARLDRPAERPPFEPHPDAPFERIEMLIEAVVVSMPEPQLGLNAMEQPVKHVLLAYIGIRAREHRQWEVEPPQPAPGDGAVRETRKAG